MATPISSEESEVPRRPAGVTALSLWSWLWGVAFVWVFLLGLPLVLLGYGLWKLKGWRGGHPSCSPRCSFTWWLSVAGPCAVGNSALPVVYRRNIRLPLQPANSSSLRPAGNARAAAWIGFRMLVAHRNGCLLVHCLRFSRVRHVAPPRCLLSAARGAASYLNGAG